MTDPIADFLTRIRNAVKASPQNLVKTSWAQKLSRKSLRFFTSRVTSSLTEFDTDEKGHPSIKIALKWDAATKGNAIKDLKRVEPPGSAPLCVGFGHAPRFERPGHRHRFHVERHHDRRQGPSGERGRRGAVLYLLIANH